MFSGHSVLMVTLSPPVYDDSHIKPIGSGHATLLFPAVLVPASVGPHAVVAWGLGGAADYFGYSPALFI